MHTHTLNISTNFHWNRISIFIEIARLNKKIAAREIRVNGRTTDGQPDGRPENIIPPPSIVSGGINRAWLHPHKLKLEPNLPCCIELIENEFNRIELTHWIVGADSHRTMVAAAPWEKLGKEKEKSTPTHWIVFFVLSYSCSAFVANERTHSVERSAMKYIITVSPIPPAPLPSARQHPSYGDCLEVKREYYQNCSVLGCMTQCSQSAAHSYEQFLQVQQIGFVTLGPLRHA